MGQRGFFDVQERLEGVSRLGDPLERLGAEIPWESFRRVLRKVRDRERKSSAGRRPFDGVMMFKALVLQSLYNLSDEQVEYQVRDRLSFMRFLGLGIEDPVPDATTLWRFREALVELGLMERLFARFAACLEERGYEARKGQIVDASVVEVPRQRNTREENQRSKAGEEIEGWSEAKRRQKDTDARWTKKHGQSYYGYKNHVSVDREHKLVRRFSVTDAAVHDSQVLGELLDPANSGAGVWGDSAYRSREAQATLKEAGYRSRVHYKGSRAHPLSGYKEALNQKLSKVRARVEHVFGFQENSMGGKFIRTIGRARARLKIGLMNLTYNLMRYLQLERNKSRTLVPLAA